MFSQEIEINLKINKEIKEGGKHMKKLIKILPILMTVQQLVQFSQQIY